MEIRIKTPKRNITVPRLTSSLAKLLPAALILVGMLATTLQGCDTSGFSISPPGGKVWNVSSGYPQTWGPSSVLTHALGPAANDERSKYMMQIPFSIQQTLDPLTGDPTNPCAIEYKLVETEQRAKDPVPTDGSDLLHPIQEMHTVFGNNIQMKGNSTSGEATISFHYTPFEQTWRENFEQKDWDVQLIAGPKGKGDLLDPTNQFRAVYDFTIKFRLECNYQGVQLTPYHNLGAAYTVTFEDQPIQINANTLSKPASVTSCDYENNRQLELFYTVANPLNDTELKYYSVPTDIMTLDQDLRQVIIHKQISDTNVETMYFNGTTDCQLWKTDTYNCVFNIKVKEKNNAGQEYGLVGGGAVTIHSECYRLAEAKGNMTLQNSYWTWEQKYIDTVAHGYRLRDPGINFTLPWVEPILFSGEFFYDRCGPIYYNITVEEVPEYYNYSYPIEQDGSKGIYVTVNTTDELFVKDYGPSFARLWGKTAILTATLELYPDTITYTSHFDLSFILSDYCLGWSMSPRNITINDPRSTVTYIRYDTNWPYTPKMEIQKYVLSPKTSFDFSFLDYTQLSPDDYRVNWGCGQLVYKPSFWEDEMDDRRDLVYTLDADYEQEEGLRFHVDALHNRYIGKHLWNITIESDILTYEPQPEFQVIVNILPCFVREIDTRWQRFDDIEILYQTTIELLFQDFRQVPLCNYTVDYTITLFEKRDANATDEKLDLLYERQMYGDPRLVSLDLDKGALIIDAEDFNLVNKTFQVFIGYHVDVDQRVQKEKSKFLFPFDITVVSNLTAFAPDNNGPILEGWVESLKLWAGQTKTYSLGKPFDIEEDQFYMAGWSVDSDDDINWILFNNQTSKKSVDFTFNPPRDAIGKTYYLLVQYADIHPNQTMSEYECTIEVLDPQAAFVPVFNTTEKEERKEIKPVIIEELRAVKVKIGALSSAGLLTIQFSDKVRLPSNFTKWTSENEGADFIDVNYFANEQSEILFEDLKVTMEFGWKIHTVEYKDKNSNFRRLQPVNQTDDATTNDEAAMNGVFGITLQMQWTAPLYVSQNIQQDTIAVKVLPQVFEFDPEVTVEEEKTDQFYYEGRAPQQVSAGQLKAIETVQDAADGFLKVFMGTNFFLSFFMIGVLQFLWGLINTLQMIMFTVLFSISFPLNCSKIMIAIMKLTNLDVIDTETILNAIWTFKIEAAPISAVFEEAGYESSNFIIELGPLFFIISASILVYLAKLLLIFLLRDCGKNCLTNRIRRRISLSVIIVRFLCESCIEVGLVALISARMFEKERFSFFQDGFAMILAFIAVICLLITPFYLIHVGKKLQFRPAILTEDEKKNIQKLFEAYRPNDYKAVRFGAIFFFRRFFMLCVLIMLPSQRNVQIVAQLWSTLYLMSHTASVQPYKDRLQNVQEVFNECTVLVGSYHLFGFTEWIYDYERRLELGWSLIAVIVLNVCFNFTVLTVIILKENMKKARVKYLKQVQQSKIAASRKRALIKRGHLILGLDDNLNTPQSKNPNRIQGNHFLQLDSIPEISNEDSSPRDKRLQLISAKLKPKSENQSKAYVMPFVEDVVVEPKSRVRNIYDPYMTDAAMIISQLDKPVGLIEEEKKGTPIPGYKLASKKVALKPWVFGETKPKRSLAATQKMQSILAVQVEPRKATFEYKNIDYSGPLVKQSVYSPRNLIEDTFVQPAMSLLDQQISKNYDLYSVPLFDSAKILGKVQSSNDMEQPKQLLNNQPVNHQLDFS